MRNIFKCYSTSLGLSLHEIHWRHELRPYGVRVILVLPGSFESGMQDTKRLLDMMDSVWDRSSQKIRDEYGNDYIIKGMFCAYEGRHLPHKQCALDRIMLT